jgi:hypothetical protein
VAGSGELNGISCGTPTTCVAVGEVATNARHARPLIESWNGIAWSIVPNSAPKGTTVSTLNSVSCLASGQCKAVGHLNGEDYVDQTLVETWNGSRWSIVPSPNPVPAGDNLLFSVSCTEVHKCIAVGGSSGSSAPQAIVESWNGTEWMTVPVPIPSGTFESELMSVSCASPRNCTAVGFAYSESATVGQTLVEHWNGASWLEVHSANRGNFSALQGVSCSGNGGCTAVGYHSTSLTSRQLTLVEVNRHSNGG